MRLKRDPNLCTIAAALCALAAAASAHAEEPDTSLSYNIGVVSDYRYRGLSQSRGRPALQGGADWSSKAGLYVGGWASTITWIKDSTAAPNATRGSVETDIYGGREGVLNDALSYDVGLLQYWYAGNNLGDTPGFRDANTTEVYGALSHGIFTAKYSHSLTTLFGTPRSTGSGYFDLSAAVDLGNGWTVKPHLGHQRIRNFGSYLDHSLTLAKDFDGLVASAAVIGTNWKDPFGVPYTLAGTGARDLGKAALVLGLKKTF